MNFHQNLIDSKNLSQIYCLMSSFDKSDSFSFLIGYFQDFSFGSWRQDIFFNLWNEKNYQRNQFLCALIKEIKKAIKVSDIFITVSEVFNDL